MRLRGFPWKGLRAGLLRGLGHDPVRVRRGRHSAAWRGREALESLEGRELLSAGGWRGGLGPGGAGAVHARRGHHRAGAEVVRARGTVGGGGVSVQKDIVYTVDGGDAMKLDLYRPTGRPPSGGWPAVVAFPGGGWHWASKAEYGGHVSALAKYGFVVAVADYTYAGDAPGSRAWPLDFQDARDAVRWVRRNADRLGVDPGKIAAEGVSSGSYLANLLGTYPDGPVPSDSPPPDPTGPGTASGVSARVQAVVDFYGPVNLPDLYRDAPMVRPDLTTFLGGTPDEIPARYEAASVDRYISPDDPPFYIIQGTADTTVPPSQSDRLEAGLKQAGVPYRRDDMVGLPHGFQFRVNKDINLLPRVATFLDQALNRRPISTS